MRYKKHRELLIVLVEKLIIITIEVCYVFFFLNLFLPSWRCISCRCPSPRRCYCNSSITPKESPHLQIISEGRGLFEIVVHLLQHTNVKTPILFSPSLPCLNPASLLLSVFFIYLFLLPKISSPNSFSFFLANNPLALSFPQLVSFPPSLHQLYCFNHYHGKVVTSIAMRPMQVV